MTRFPKLNKSQIYILGVTIAIVFGLLSVSVVMAALFTIDTNNNSAADWDGVPIFQTDATGDVSSSCAGGSATDDIIETFVASGPEGSTPTWIYFRVRTASADAVSTDYHWVSAYVDCEPFEPDIKDANIIYAGFDDVVLYVDGQLPDPDAGNNYGQPSDEGERPANGLDTVEWSVKFSDIVPNPSYNNDPNCTAESEARIKFSIIKVNTSGKYDCTYDETIFSGFNIPTIVNLDGYSVRSSSSPLIIVSLISMTVAVIVGFLGFVIIRKKSLS